MRTALTHVVYTLVAVAMGLCLSRFVVDMPLLSVFQSLQLHIAVLSVATVGLMLLVRRSVAGFLMLAAALALTGQTVWMAQRFTTAATPPAAGAATFRMISFNILKENFGNGERIADMVLASGADLVVLLEAVPVQSSLDRLATAYPYRLGCGRGTSDCDLLLLSRQRFLAENLTDLSGLRPNRLAVVDVELGGRLVHVLAGHFSKPYYDEYHASELRRIGAAISLLKAPVILAGDFNAASIAADMQRFLARTGLRSAPFEPATWPVAAGGLGVAIDHIYGRAPLRLVSTRRIDDAMGSNHFGLIADFVIDGEAGAPSATR